MPKSLNLELPQDWANADALEQQRLLNDRLRQICRTAVVSSDAAAGTLLIGLHSERPAAAFRLGAFYLESDRTVLYSAEAKTTGNPAWRYVAGTMEAASAPTDLGAPDTNFQFRNTGTGKYYRWTGAAWFQSNGPQQSDPGAPPSAVTGTADGTYDATEQDMLNDLKAAVNSLITIVGNLRTALQNVGHCG